MAMQQSAARIPRSRSFEHGVPLVLRPIFRAYVLGYASSTLPRIMTLALLYIGRRSKNADGKSEEHDHDAEETRKSSDFRRRKLACL